MCDDISFKQIFDELGRASDLNQEHIDRTILNVQRFAIKSDVDIKKVKMLSDSIRSSLSEDMIPSYLRLEENLKYFIITEFVKILCKPAIIDTGTRDIILINDRGTGDPDTALHIFKFLSRRGITSQIHRCHTEFNEFLKKDARCMNENIKEIRFWSHCEAQLNENLDCSYARTIRILESGSDSIIKNTEICNSIEPSDKRTILFCIDMKICKDPVNSVKKTIKDHKINGMIITRISGSDKWTGVLSFLKDADIPAYFISRNDSPGILEPYDPKKLVSRLAGKWDMEVINERMRELILDVNIDPGRMIRRKITLYDAFHQLEMINGMGSPDTIMSMLPPKMRTGKVNLIMYRCSEKLQKFKVIMDSMTEEEKENPMILNRTRIQRIARGSGKDAKDVKEILEFYRILQRTIGNIKANHGDMNILRIMKKMKI